MKTNRSDELYEEAKRLMPGGVNSPVRAFKSVGRNPVFIDHAYKDRIVDVDGNEYIDYVCSWGPGILGHADPDVVKAVKTAVEKGLTFGASTANENEIAKIVKRAYPFIDKVRLVNSGTEAVMSAIRATRGYTGRDKILKFDGCYHGHSDSVLVSSGSGLLTYGKPDSAGIPESVINDTIVAPYNDIRAVENIFDKHQKDIAAIIVEPVAANKGVVPPVPGFLEELRNIADKYGSVLIFDEVITGFRLSFGGASQYYKVTPDVITLGKIIGGGMPLAAFAGKNSIMKCISPDGNVYQAGTLSGNPVATSAGIATLEKLQRDKEIYKRLEQKSAYIEGALRELNDATVTRVGSLVGITFGNKDSERYADFFKFLFERNIYIAPSQYEAMFISDAHTDNDLERTVQIIREYVRK